MFEHSIWYLYMMTLWEVQTSNLKIMFLGSGAMYLSCQPGRRTRGDGLYMYVQV